MENIPQSYKGKLKELLSSAEDITIIGHHNPDGDAVGSALGMYITLINAGFNASVVMPTKPAEFLKWLPKFDEVIIFEDSKEKAEEKLYKADVIICVDFNEFKRAEAAKEALENSKAVKILIDHHPNPGNETDYIFSFTNYSSASEIVYDFIKLIEFENDFDKNAAVCIYTGIMTDTLNFSVNSSSERTFMNVAKLISYGINKEMIYDKVYNNFSETRLRLVGYLLHKKMKFLKEYKFSYMILTKGEMKDFNFEEGDQEGIVNMPLSIKGINASVIAIEKDDYVKVSLRSKFDTDVNLLARLFFHGGGHVNAAGGKIFRKVEDAESYITESVKTYFKDSER